MSFRVRSYRDLGAAALFAAISLIFFWSSLDFNMGTANQMGPAYLPRVLCGLMLVISIILLVRSFRHESKDEDTFSFRPTILVPLAMVVFALALKPLGLVLSVWLTVGIAAFAGDEAKPLEVAISALVLSFLSVAVFVYGLKLAIPVWPGV